MLTALPLLRGAGPSPVRQQILFFTKSAGFEHEAIKPMLKDGRPGFAIPVIDALGRKNNIEFVFSKDA